MGLDWTGLDRILDSTGLMGTGLDWNHCTGWIGSDWMGIIG